MDLKNRHPLNAIDGYENLSMLEALIPFVEYQLKLPLALFIKFSEIRLIIKCFQSPNNLTRLGLHCATNDPWEMIGSLTGMSPELIRTMMSMMNGSENSMFSDLFNNFSNDNSTNDENKCQSPCKNEESDVSSFSVNNMSNMINIMQNMKTPFTTSSDENTSAHNFNNHASLNYPTNDDSLNTADDFEDNIQKLLAEYDLQQADSLYNEKHSNNTTYENANTNY